MMPTSQFRVSLSKVMQELSLDVINMCGDPDKIMILFHGRQPSRFGTQSVL